MKKEYQLVLALGLFALSYTLDYFAGPVTISIRNPFILGGLLDKYPFTAVAIGARSIAICLSVTLILSITTSNFTKAIVGFFLACLFELYAIQQLATLSRTTTTQWTLSFSYGGLLMIFPIVFYIVAGIFFKLHQSLGGEKPKEDAPPPLTIERETE